eukprot:TRINITY_DN67805_c8_g4_i2.p1 TRINITY_DN67805_c8_g4~~TRINITY_DN67805_c8_g4_i2.p1  ORF type:complete len:537 (+),score=297.12 TRINITY_DN67805_c8_g4_i2:76-1686(+)
MSSSGKEGGSLSRLGRSMSHQSVPMSHEEALKLMEEQNAAASSSSSNSGGGGSSSETTAKKKRKAKKKKTTADFVFGGILGEGSYAKVMQATLKSENKMYAAKVVDKAFVRRHNKVGEMLNEKTVLSMLNHRHVIRLHFTFQDEFSLYYVMDLAPNGELFNLIQTMGRLHVDMARVYAAELVNTLEYLHRKRIIHRDLKPENVLIDSDGHIKVTDFATSKIVEKGPDDNTSAVSLEVPEMSEASKRKNSFVGTAEYVAPELLDDQPVTFATDLWALGCIVFQMLAGRPPFRGESEYLTFQQILSGEINFPPDFDEDAKDLIQKLLVKESSKRLGAAAPEGFNAIRKHPFFASINFETVHQSPPPHFDDFVQKLEQLQVDEKDSDSDEDELAMSPASANRASVKSTNSVSSTSSSSSLKRQDSSLWLKYLGEDEQVLFHGRIQKRGVGLGAMFYKKRQLILTDKPRLLYINMANLQKRGEIPWSDALFASLRKEPYFYIHTPNRVYDIKAVNKTAREWVDTINQAKKRMHRPSSITL